MTDADYAAALAEIERLFRTTDPDEETRLHALVDAVVAYEAVHYPIPAPPESP